MTERELVEFVINGVSEHLYKVLWIGVSTFIAIGTGTWFVCSKWYQRQIKHLTQTKESDKDSYKQQVQWLEQRIQHTNSYANGMIDFYKHQITTLENNISLNNQNRTIADYEIEINSIKEKYEREIESLKDKNVRLYQQLKESKSSKDTMLNNLSVVVLFISKHFKHHEYFHYFDLCYKDLVASKKDDDFYTIFIDYSMLLTHLLIDEFIKVEKENKIRDLNFFNSRITDLNHSIKAIKPMIWQFDIKPNIKQEKDKTPGIKTEDLDQDKD